MRSKDFKTSPTSAGARTPSFGVGGPGVPAELGVVLTSMTFGVSPVAISLFFPEFISVLHVVPVAKDLLRYILCCAPGAVFFPGAEVHSRACLKRL